jgi:hypothetical protein
MATLVATHPTLLDVAKRTDPDGKIARIVELLSQTNEILEDAVWIECNNGTGHRTTVRTGLPTPTWRKLYGGVTPSKSTTAQVEDSCGMLEAYAEVDKALADMNGNAAEFRLSEEAAHREGMNQEFCSTLFLGDESSEPEAFTGFGPRFNDLSGPENAGNIINADSGGGGGDQTSIWLIVWAPTTVHCIYPKGSKAGLQHRDFGEVTVENATDYSGGAVGGGRFQAYRSHYRWDAGLSVRDWRYVVRICNIDTGRLVKDAETGADLTDCMAQALELIPSLSMGRAVFYCNRTVKSFLRRQIASAVKQSTLTMQQVGGKHVLHFDDVPVRRCDQILNTEAVIS